VQLVICSQGLDLSQRMKDAAERKLRFVLGRFGTRIRRTTAFVSAGQTPLRGMNKRCRIMVSLRPSGQVVIEVADKNVNSALNRAVDRLGPAISRDLTWRREARSLDFGFKQPGDPHGGEI
jgi:ribosome-associated translation inhibitor RaiA